MIFSQDRDDDAPLPSSIHPRSPSCSPSYIMGMSKLLALGALASAASGEHLNVP
jgi:hypothetical protein